MSHPLFFFQQGVGEQLGSVVGRGLPTSSSEGDMEQGAQELRVLGKGWDADLWGPGVGAQPRIGKTSRGLRTAVCLPVSH